MTSQEDVFSEFLRASKQTYSDEAPHLQDLWLTPIKSHPAGGSEYKIKAEKSHLQHLSFIVRAAIDSKLTLLTDWTLVFKHPLYWLYLLFVNPVILFTLFVAEVALLVVDTLKLEFIKTSIHKRWSKYTTHEDLFDAEFFHKEENRSVVDDGVSALDKPYHQVEGEEEEHLPFNTARQFDLDIAQILLFMSDVIYNRDTEKVLEATEKVNVIKRHPEKRDELLREIVDLLQESDDAIKAQAKKWQLKYKSVSELNTLGESYAGIFYSERHDFIVVAFKGPTAEKFDSFVNDLMFQRVDGRPIIGFKAYDGYRTMLYPETDKPGPYTTITDAIRNVAHVIHGKTGRPVNVWVTGHSMGGALATMFYGRCLKSPSDLGEHCILRDAYTFGSPPVGDSEFASTYLSSSNKQRDAVSTLWRVVSDKDILTRLPPGFYHPDGVWKHNILDNAHIGEAIKFYPDGRKPKLIRNPLTSGKNQVPIIKSSTPKEDARLEIPIHSSDEKLPSFIKDHLIYRYCMALAFARNHLVEGGEGSVKTKGYHGEITLEYEN